MGELGETMTIKEGLVRDFTDSSVENDEYALKLAEYVASCGIEIDSKESFKTQLAEARRIYFTLRNQKDQKDYYFSSIPVSDTKDELRIEITITSENGQTKYGRSKMEAKEYRGSTKYQTQVKNFNS